MFKMASEQNLPQPARTGTGRRAAKRRNKNRNAAASQPIPDTFDEDELSDDDDEQHMLEGNKQVQVEFDVRAPEKDDVTGIVSLLRQSFPSVPFSLVDLAASLVQNRSVGNMLVAVSPSDDEDEDDEEASDVNFDDVEQIMGITTIAKLSSDTKIMKEIRNFIQSLCSTTPDDSTTSAAAPETAKKQFAELFSKASSSLGMLVNERLMNIPASVIAPLFQRLKDDYEKAVRANKWPKHTHFVYFIKMYQPPTPKANPKEQSKPVESAKTFEYVAEEDELVSKIATCHIDYNIAHQHAGAPSGGKWSSDKEMIPYRRVCLLEVDKFWALLPELEQLKVEMGNINITPMDQSDDEEYEEKN